MKSNVPQTIVLVLALGTLAVGLGCTTSARAEDAHAKKTLDNGSKIYRSGYYLGRGDTGISLADDEEAIFYNPAGLALGKGIYKKTVLVSPQVEVSQATRDMARNLAAENADTVQTVRDNIGKPNHIGISNFTGLLLRRAAIGAVATSNVDLLTYKSDKDALETIAARADQTVGMTFTLADSFWKNQIMLGVTGKYLARGKGELEVAASEADKVQAQLEDQKNFLGMGEGGGADIGLMWQGGGKNNPAFGLTIADIGDTKITPKDETELDLDIKQTVNAGVSIEPGTKFSKLRLLADYRDIFGRTIDNPRKRLHLGGELSVLNMVGMTAGLNQGYPTAGLYCDIYFVRLDAGFYTEEMGTRVGTRGDTRYFVRLKVGF